MSESDLLQTTDAEVWAREFVARFDAHRIDVDVDVMLTWFANAIETGRTAGQADSVQRRTLEAVEANARSWHAGEAGKEAALRVIAEWSTAALEGHLHSSVEKLAEVSDD